MKRRSFLTSAASCLTALGVGQILLDDCRSVLAAPAPRKLAILIGINDYFHGSLKGCVTDVEIQENLLLHRFGFQPQDIFKLTNQAATTAAVTQLFANELRQIQSNDLVILHFSGKGGISLNQQPMLMLADGSSIAWEEMARMLRTCPTRKILTVLDTSYQPSPHRMLGNRRVRSTTPETETQLIQAPIESLPGIVVSANPNQVALETDYADFSAGQLTYSFAQALWQSSPTLLSNLDSNLSQTGSKSDRSEIETILSSQATAPSIGAITQVDTVNNAEVWLGGIAASQLEVLGNQGVLQSAPGQTLQILSRQGLKAKVRNLSAEPIQPSSILQEQIRVISKGLPLEIAIDPSLPKIERVDAVAAFANLPNVTTKAVGEGSADYLLAKIPQPNSVVASLPDAPVSDVVPSARYGLFTINNQAIATASGSSGEAIKSTIKRIHPIVQSLYAAKLLNLLENRSSSRFPVGIALEALTPKSKPMLRQGTPAIQLQTLKATPIPVGSSLRYQVIADSIDPPHWLLIGWNNRHEMDIVLPSAQTMSFEGIAHEPGGTVTVYLIASDRPFTQTLNHLAQDGTATTLQSLPQPLGVIQALMQDLSIDEVEGRYRFDVDRYAAIRSQYELVV